MAMVELVKESDYEISQVRQTENIVYNSGSHTVVSRHTLTKTFNFEAQQITTCMCTELYSPAGYGSSANAAVSVSTQMHIQNFDDVQSNVEIERMRKHLIQLGGTPPELSGIVKKSFK